MTLPLDYSLSAYHFDLPEELIAQSPPVRRGDSRLMVLDRKAGKVQHAEFVNILQFLPKNCLLVANNSRVVPARMHGWRERSESHEFGLTGGQGRTGGKVEFVLLTPPPLLEWQSCEDKETSADACNVNATLLSLKLQAGGFECASTDKVLPWLMSKAEGLIRPVKKIRVGEFIFFSANFAVQLVRKGDFGRVEVILYKRGDMQEILDEFGALPLPPYIRRPVDAEDARRYQTVYAKRDKAGSAAAPTAGLHFTPEIRSAIEASGREWVEVTLYVGYGTFSPVRCQDIREHPMHAEYVELSQETSMHIAKAKAEGRPVIAIGTTSARVVEGVFAKQAEVQDIGLAGDMEHWSQDSRIKSDLSAYTGAINIFLYPGKSFHVIDGLLTNFHLPESSLLMLVSAFAGRENIMAAYARAIEERYRFFSYGDAMLII